MENQFLKELNVGFVGFIAVVALLRFLTWRLIHKIIAGTWHLLLFCNFLWIVLGWHCELFVFFAFVLLFSLNSTAIFRYWIFRSDNRYFHLLLHLNDFLLLLLKFLNFSEPLLIIFLNDFLLFKFVLNFRLLYIIICEPRRLFIMNFRLAFHNFVYFKFEAFRQHFVNNRHLDHICVDVMRLRLIFRVLLISIFK